MFTELTDLASRSLGGAVLAANDESFAEKECLIRDAAPVFSANTFGHKGQIYDGWETRRRRRRGHDWVVIRLAVPGVVHGIVIDTAFFKGNFPPEASVEACTVDGYPSVEELLAADWRPIMERSGIAGDTGNAFTVDSPHRHTHVRLNIFPDGGVARLRVHGVPVPDPRDFAVLPMDLAALTNGGTVVGASNAFYSRPASAIMPGDAASQADGWETRRRRDGGNDWLLLQLAGRGELRLAELDTSHLKFNAPGWAALRGLDTGAGGRLDDDDAWFDLLGRTRLQPDTRHRFRLPETAPVTHVRLEVFPDGGMARLRLFGELTAAALRDLRERFTGLNPAPPTPRRNTAVG